MQTTQRISFSFLVLILLFFSVIVASAVLVSGTLAAETSSDSDLCLDMDVCKAAAKRAYVGPASDLEKRRAVWLWTQVCNGAFPDYQFPEALDVPVQARACAVAAFNTEGSKTPDADKIKKSLLQRGCDLGDPRSCGALAHQFRVSSNYPQAALLYQIACDKSNGKKYDGGCSWLTNMYSFGKLKNSPIEEKKKIKALLETWCAKGNKHACKQIKWFNIDE
jgi:TPR repeat protein